MAARPFLSLKSKIYLTFRLVKHTIFLRGEPLGKNLKMKAARAALGLTQQDLAEAVGVTRQTIVAIERGDYNPTIKLCVEICKALGKTLDELFWEP